MNIEQNTWGVAFAVDDLEAASAYLEDVGISFDLAHDHAGACEALHLASRTAASSSPYQFMVYCPTEREGQYAVSEGEVDGLERLAYFGDLMAALRFCKAQRGADWPTDAHTQIPLGSF